MIKNALRFALGIFRGKTIYNFVFVALCGVLQTHFHGKTQRQTGDFSAAQLFPQETSAATAGFRYEPFVKTQRRADRSLPGVVLY